MSLKLNDCYKGSYYVVKRFFFIWHNTLQGLLIHEVSRSQRRTTVDRTPLGEWSARRRDLYRQHTTLTTDRHPCPQRYWNPQSRQASVRWDRQWSGY